MQYSQGSIGRIFTLRLEDDERVPDCIEQFARDHDIKAAMCTMIGGIDRGNIVAGPKDGESPVIDPILHAIGEAHEVLAMGTLFPDESGEPVLHMHAALGRDGQTRTGCIRPGLDVWLVGEVIIMEILHTDMLRKKEAKSGLALLCKG
ncbi:MULTISPECIES: PPC domain-containing DNA-binding protein [unclassified Pseudodesulfovibrio]|uniref:PPC domain-containing DNA-binding protein n=1 Tax=unclassified Pseudodesulfovibrio TaxID=2661612 RepID=UPI000FEC0121|nr:MULTISPECIES: PPC domain-containing DNA-binding protein [unclassified Pseudodesulfovibrio]MCJ2163302.1 DNA-binding protein [Pseudodesulfovibrio sp. S3-i]RWU07281.1 DNA-binding protein [Pseudodesulfovibrio sp. S3]